MLAVMLVATGVVVYADFRRDLDRTINADLRQRASDLADLAEQLDPRATLAEGGERVAQIYSTGGRMLASTRRAANERLLTGAEARRAARRPLLVSRERTAMGDDRVRAVGAPARARAVVVVAVGERLTRRDHALSHLRTLLFLAGPLALLLATYAGYQVAGAALRPVERMRRRAADITERDTSERLPVPPTGDEIAALGDTFNELLGRLDAAIERERRLLSDASHELRTPLTVLRTGIEVALRRERDAAELREALESAGRETQRLSRLAEDLLVVARADQGQLPLRTEPLDVAQVLDGAAGRARAAASTAGRGVRAEPPRAELRVLADPDRTSQALDNLVANAVSHGSGDIRLIANEADGRVELHVVDEGEGFPEDLLAHAFDRFSQGNHARSGEGTGLGLAIVAAIARAHGGDAGARNLSAGGADVWITLPSA